MRGKWHYLNSMGVSCPFLWLWVAISPAGSPSCHPPAPQLWSCALRVQVIWKCLIMREGGAKEGMPLRALSFIPFIIWEVGPSLRPCRAGGWVLSCVPKSPSWSLGDLILSSGHLAFIFQAVVCQPLCSGPCWSHLAVQKPPPFHLQCGSQGPYWW